MPSRLSDLKAAEVSVVPHGANLQKFLVVKEDAGSMDKLLAAIKEAGLEGKLSEPVTKALEPILKTLSDKGKAALESAMKILMAVKEELPPELVKALMAAADVGNPLPPEPVKQEDPSATAAVAPAGEAMPVMKDGAWDYSKIPEAIRPTIEAIWKEKVGNDAKLAQITKQLDDERDQRVTKEFVAKATVLKSLGVKTEDLGRVMKEVSEKAPEAFKLLEPMLKSFDEKIAKGGLFTEVGTTGATASAEAKPGQTEAETKIEAIAKGLVEKSADGKKLSHTAAVAKAWQDNPALYNQHEAEIAAARAGK